MPLPGSPDRTPKISPSAIPGPRRRPRRRTGRGLLLVLALLLIGLAACQGRHKEGLSSPEESHSEHQKDREGAEQGADSSTLSTPRFQPPPPGDAGERERTLAEAKNAEALRLEEGPPAYPRRAAPKALLKAIPIPDPAPAEPVYDADGVAMAEVSRDELAVLAETERARRHGEELGEKVQAAAQSAALQDARRYLETRLDEANLAIGGESLFGARDAKKETGRIEPELAEVDDMVFGIPDAPATGAGRESGVVPSAAEARFEARHFLDRLHSLEGLNFQQAAGYWANSYVPGDPQLRFLDDRLRAWPADSPHALSRRPIQPLDPPRRAALGVHLHADRGGLDERGRMLLRVGLRATDRFAGRRPAMNLALVVDLRAPLEAADAARLRALITAFADGREVGDRFRLIVAGAGGGLALDSGSFRHGPLLDLLHKRLLPTDEAGGAAFSIPSAFELAAREVASDDDPSAPLGSSAIVLIASSPLAAALPPVERLAHRAAVAGIPTSAVGLAAADSGEMRRLALAGQGRIYRLEDAERAESLVDRELQATSRAVARAVRLRIRLAPGVELVDVLGSRRFSEAGAQRVREAERAIDQRLQRSLGLAADRGEDDEGIQIVIPAFYAGDSHAILLDIVAPGPGAIADVSVRFKDLVHLENGVTRAHLALGRGEPAAGALERSVLESRLAVELQDELAAAARQLKQGEREAAITRLRRLERLLAGLVHEIPGLEHHRGLERDRLMLTRFAAAIRGAEDVAPWIDALRYAGLRKLLPAPESLG